jgi:hypothetical protein
VSGDYGATLRFYDTKIDAWRSTLDRPSQGLRASHEGDFESGRSRKWIFSDITGETFKWRAVESDDGWLTEQKVQEMSARRHRNRG